MEASGNGSVQRCALNLISWQRGSIPLDRVRGLGAHVDRSSKSEIEEDVRWLVKNYDPRAEIESLAIERTAEGDFSIDLNVTDKAGE